MILYNNDTIYHLAESYNINRTELDEYINGIRDIESLQEISMKLYKKVAKAHNERLKNSSLFIRHDGTYKGYLRALKKSLPSDERRKLSDTLLGKHGSTAKINNQFSLLRNSRAAGMYMPKGDKILISNERLGRLSKATRLDRHKILSHEIIHRMQTKGAIAANPEAPRTALRNLKKNTPPFLSKQYFTNPAEAQAYRTEAKIKDTHTKIFNKNSVKARAFKVGKQMSDPKYRDAGVPLHKGNIPFNAKEFNRANRNTIDS